MIPKNIVLVGPMGAGKSTIGKQLASTLDFNFIDVDQCIVEQAGADIPWIFHKEGEEGFRKRETFSLKLGLTKNNAVIATGGGVVKLQENVQLLNQARLVVYLKADVETQYQRTAKDKNRPLIQEENPKKKLAELMQQRSPLYELVSDLALSTDELSVNEVINIIMQKWQEIS